MPSSTSIDPVVPLIAGLERRARLGVFVQETARLGMMAAFVLGGLVLALRLLFELEPADVAASLWGLAVVPVVAAFRAARRGWI